MILDEVDAITAFDMHGWTHCPTYGNLNKCPNVGR